MKFIFSAILLIACQTVFAQVYNPTKCGIWYDYDNAGNRIKRYYDCKSDTGDQTNPLDLNSPPTKNRSIAATDSVTKKPDDLVSVFPNPIRDHMLIMVGAPAADTRYYLYNATGALLFSGTLAGTEARINIANLAVGPYNLVVYYHSVQHYFKLVKLD